MSMMTNSTIQLIAVATISLFTGCCIGSLLTLPSINTPITSPATSTTSTNKTPPSSTEYLSDDEQSAYEQDEDDQDEDEDIPEVNSKALNDVPGECRMALVIRQDLQMQKGKIAAQCAHAALACYRLISNPQSPAYNDLLLNRWLRGGQAKITLKVPDKDEMDMLFAKALSLDVNCYIVHDAGRTQVASGSATVLGLGPAPKSVLDQITGELKLY